VNINGKVTKIFLATSVDFIVIFSTCCGTEDRRYSKDPII